MPRKTKRPEPAAVVELPIELIYGNPDQPRQAFGPAELEDLAISIAQNGLVQPIKVTKRGRRYMIVAGERRFRSHQLNGAKTILCLVQAGMSERDVMIEAIIENRQRTDITPLEEAVAFQRCLDAGMTPAELATKLGLQQEWRITERTCLLGLRPEYQQLARSGQLGASQAYEMAQLAPAAQDQLFKAIRRGDCVSYAQLRSMALVLRDRARQITFLAEDEPSPPQRQLAKGLERRFAKVAAVLRASTVDNEIVAVKKVDPGRAGTLADLISAMRGDLARIETALRAAGNCMEWTDLQ